GAIRQGGSTITQQLAKNYFLTPERTYTRKFNELLISITLELKYEKEEILEIYLNEIYFGQKGNVSVNGVGEASVFYFGKTVEKLALEEAAVLGGIIKAPNHYSPYVNKKKCRKRRDFVLEAMYKKEWISFADFMDAKAKPVATVGYTTYGKKAPYFLDYLSNQLTVLYPEEVLSSLGMSIYTTLDTQVQEAAEKALMKGLASLEKTYPSLVREKPEEKLQGAVVVMQPKTGAILAMVGGRDYNVSQFNRVTQAVRQPGSAFKPFVFLSALDAFTPATFLSNEPKTYVIDGKSWEPKNFKPTDENRVTMRRALAKSYNIATVDMAMKVGLDRIVHQAKKLHFSTTLKPYPSLALGAFEVIPLELARAYCVFAADGTQPFPLSLKDVMDENETVLERRHMLIESLIPPEKAFIMSSLMRSVVTEGTARSLEARGITWPVAGKTGTTNDFKDAWFVGYTPDILALVWVGFDNGDSINATGSSAALPIWADLMKSIPHHISGDWFKVPSEIVKLVVCSETGLLAENRMCPKPMEEYFLKGLHPTEECPVHESIGMFKKIVRGIKKLVD
ncbi:MAG: transglycosylase domain-containing protein, partial [Deltaproteobacteria bacterium]|nr:transglycosylase domain-containing protein [Deltaproteobacteria bacterium]